MTHSATPSQPEKSVDVALAEFKALRDEVLGAFTKQGAILVVGLTALGLVLTTGLKKDSDPSIMMTAPPLAAVVSILHTAEWAKYMRIGQYIRSELWPFLEMRTGYDKSWEQWVYTDTRSFRPRALLQRLATEGVAVPGVFAAGAVGALIFYPGDLSVLQWIYSIACLVVAVLVPLGFWVSQLRQES